MARQNTVQESSPGNHPERMDAAEEMRAEPLAESARVGMTADGKITLVLPPGQVVTGAMAAEAAQEIENLAGVRRLPLLLTLTGVESISRTARDIFSAARSLSAVAVIGISPVDRVIANFLLGGEVQPCPTRYFSREKDALDWLKRHAP
ncbi:STAS/SEC14 domain-containing protein [Arthrobacter zhangbolii]|uniref:STAS/SEC14 domain-containing protein n=1 Tax=Arthrobacter zhangbolii TaxID=2886936 RepID=A0A9X1M7U2_9MICC|nr:MULTISPECIES: STAS/SEC14 domain-containing protein [Arthrobacter]MCC3272994.1 STAS/SEC14 domain-containing protein [Arthrobacter zhangbolii]MCC3295334.1 STAS/SEC14 domain-containing protein [Arthrobacter zhangbolii]MDN3905232.1 STAS/SEC14 domain-containing protein [Arthrobacter sp. YD2]UON93043.1 STAS/SEC14 domain-containing protein [Arthrobacter zhangbolii]